MKKSDLLKQLEERKDRSAWDKGVTFYAMEILENVEKEEITSRQELKKALLNGAENWQQYSWGGCSYVYDKDIAETLCTPSELKRNDHGRLRPNSREEWLDVQARALYQAACRILKAFKE